MLLSRSLLAVVASCSLIMLLAAERPASAQKTLSVDTIFHTVAADPQKPGGPITIDWLEQLVTSKSEALQGIGQNMPSIVYGLFAQKPNFDVTLQDFNAWTLGTFLHEALTFKIITQSCGQSTSLLHEILAPSSYAQADQLKQTVDEAGVLRLIADENRMSNQDDEHHYVIVEGGGHSFTVECHGDKCRLYQSFFGNYTLAADLARNKVWTISELLAHLDAAMEPYNPSKAPSARASSARRELWNCNVTQVHPDGRWRVTRYKQENGTTTPITRLIEKLTTTKATWDQDLARPAVSFMKPEGQIGKLKAGNKLHVSWGADVTMYSSDGAFTKIEPRALEDGRSYIMFYKGEDAYYVTASDKTSDEITLTVTGEYL